MVNIYAQEILDIMNPMIGIIIGLLALGGGLVFGLWLLFFANRIIMWSERTFSPAANAIAKWAEGNHYQPRATPSRFIKAGTWALRIIGLPIAVSCGWVLYFIISRLIK